MTSGVVDGRRGRVAVCGAGYVGAAVAEAFASVADVCVRDPRLASSATADEIAAADVVFVCVPTPEGPDGAADMGHVRSVIRELASARARAVIVVKSTVPPGSTSRLAMDYPSLAICSSPEFLRERYARRDFERPHRIVLGWTQGISQTGRADVRALHELRFPDVPIVEMTATEAELTKYASNAFFAIKVSFANELAALSTATGSDWDTVRSALGLDPRIGPDHLAVPGPDGAPGYGGRCLPKDAAALLHLADHLGVDLPVLESARAANATRRPLIDGETSACAPGATRSAGKLVEADSGAAQ